MLSLVHEAVDQKPVLFQHPGKVHNVVEFGCPSICTEDCEEGVEEIENNFRQVLRRAVIT